MAGFSQRGFAGIPVLILLFAGLFVGVYLVQNRTNFLPKADFTEFAPESTLEGNFLYLHKDNFEGESSETVPVLEATKVNGEELENSRFYTLDAEESLDIDPGSKVTVTGRIEGEEVEDVNRGDVRVLEGIDTSITDFAATDVKKVAVILVSFLNYTPNKAVAEKIRSEITGGAKSLEKHFEEYTYGNAKAKFEFKQFPEVGSTAGRDGWYETGTMGPKDVVGCGVSENLQEWAREADKSFQVDNGLDFAKRYQYRVYVLPPEAAHACYWGGYALYGNWSDGLYRFFVFDPTLKQIYVHEFGHVLGLYAHAGSLECRGGSIVSGYRAGECKISEYGNRFDPMGGVFASINTFGENVYHFGVPEKLQLSWVDNRLVEEVSLASGGLTYTLTPLSVAGADKKALKILSYINSGSRSAVNSHYWIEYRSPKNLDQNSLRNKEIPEGVYVTVKSDDPMEHSLLLDASPGSALGSLDSALCLKDDTGLGRECKSTFTDGRIEIKLLSIAPDSSSATVSVRRL